MTLAFIVASVIAGILFFLWLSGRDRLNESEAKIRQLTSQVETKQVRTMSTVSTSQTRLTPELVNDVIRNNGFIPLPSNDSEWIPFKWQGEVFFVSTNSLPGIQFYKGFSYKDDDNQDILKKAAEMTMDELWYGRITFSEEDDVMAFRVFAVEKGVEHFTETFMDYMKILENMVDCHRHFYQQLLHEKETFRMNEGRLSEPNKKHTAVS